MLDLLPQRSAIHFSFWRIYACCNAVVFAQTLKRHDEAISCFDCALVLDPNSGSTWNNKGSALNHLNRDEEAIVCYDRALEILPNSATAWANKGVSLCCLCRYGEAIACCDRALEIDPNSTTARNSKKVALNSLKPPVEASICVDHAQEIEPENVADLADKLLEPVYAQLMRIHDSKESANKRLELFRLNVLPLLTDAALAQTATEQATNELFDAAASVLREIYTADWNSSHDLAAARATSDLALKFARGSETRQQILDDQAHFVGIQTKRAKAKAKQKGLGILVAAAVVVGVVLIASNSKTPKSISSPTFTPANPSPEDKTYRIPKSVSAEIAEDRATIEQKKAALARFKNKVDALGNEIEQERAYLDKTSQNAIDTFNRKVNNHNALLAQMRTQNDTLNQMIDSYNAKLQRYGR